MNGRVPDVLAPDRIAVFLFHGVIGQSRHPIRNYTRKHLPYGEFDAILRELCRRGSPVSMPELVAAHRCEVVLPAYAFAVTFDDGFENNYSLAAPLLERLGVPATFYVTTGFIESNGSSWIDMIEYAVEQVTPCELRGLGDGLDGHFETLQEKRAFLNAARHFAKSHPSIDPYEFAERIWRQLGVAGMVPDPDIDQKMSWSQLRELSRHPLFEVGGHGHTHRVLAFLDDDALEQEIGTSVALLEGHLGGPRRQYSYPEGLAHCYSNREIDSLCRHGIVCSPSAVSGTNAAGDDLFHLKRLMVT